MSQQKELEKLQAKRAELETESRSLKEEQKKLECSVKILEEKVTIEELVDNNKTAKDAISNLEAKLGELENRLKQRSQTHPENPATPTPTPKETSPEVIAPSKGTEVPPEPVEKAPADSEESCVTVTAIDDEALVETQEAKSDKQQEKKKHRFF